MNENNPHAVALAGRNALNQMRRFHALGLSLTISDEKKDEIIEKLAREKDPQKWESRIAGYRQHVDLLLKFAAMTVDQQFEYEYQKAFPEVADQDEIKAAMAELSVSAPAEAA